MAQAAVSILLWVAALGCGMMAGLYFAFSTFVMAALARLPQASGVAAMQSINAVILKSLFMPLFWGTTLASLALAVVAPVRWQGGAEAAMLAGGLLYVVGMFVLTIVRNVPLNKALDAVEPASGAAAPVWARYLKEWTFWNHVRTLASLAASALFVFAIAAE